MATATGSPMTSTRLRRLEGDARELGLALGDRRTSIDDVRTKLSDLAVKVASMPPEDGSDTWDLYLYGALQRATTTALLALQQKETAQSRRDLRVALEQIRQAVRDQLEAASVLDSVPANEVAKWLVEHLDVPQAEVAGLLGTNLRTLQRWITSGSPTSPRADEEHRIRVVAACLRHLRQTLTGRGVIAWFGRQKPELGGRAPAQILDEADLGPLLVTLASRDRSHNAT